jgi:hypothetical protein
MTRSSTISCSSLLLAAALTFGVAATAQAGCAPRCSDPVYHAPPVYRAPTPTQGRAAQGLPINPAPPVYVYHPAPPIPVEPPSGPAGIVAGCDPGSPGCSSGKPQPGETSITVPGAGGGGGEVCVRVPGVTCVTN